jgi:hypothetical protein
MSKTKERGPLDGELVQSEDPPGRKPEYLYGGFGPVQAERVRVERERARLHKRMLKLRSFELPNPALVVGSLEMAIEYLDKATAELKKIPKGWKPARGTLGLTPVDVGTKVAIRPGSVDRYKDVLDDPTQAMKVTKVAGTRVVCRVKGTLIMIPRVHVRVVP